MQSEDEKKGRPFDCQVCPARIRKLRRCEENRWDFDAEKDGNPFPIQITPGGTQFGFCPSKSTWDHEIKSVFNLLMLTAETGALYTSGGLSDQPEWYLELLEFFIPTYDKMKFISKAQMILGNPKKAKPQHPSSTTSRGQNRGR